MHVVRVPTRSYLVISFVYGRLFIKFLYVILNIQSGGSYMDRKSCPKVVINGWYFTIHTRCCCLQLEADRAYCTSLQTDLAPDASEDGLPSVLHNLMVCGYHNRTQQAYCWLCRSMASHYGLGQRLTTAHVHHGCRTVPSLTTCCLSASGQYAWHDCCKVCYAGT